MTDTPTPAKKPGRPRKATAKPAQNVTTPQESPSPESKPPEGTQVPANPEIDVQRLQAIIARHMVQDHRMTWGEVRISLGYRNDDVGWAELYGRIVS